MVKRLLPLLAVLLICGCTTTSVQTAAHSLAAIGVDATLTAKPEYRPAIMKTLLSLEAYRAQNSGNVIELNRVLQQLPIVEHAPGGQIIVVNGISLLGVLRSKLNQTSGYSNYSRFAQPIATGLIEGINEAIAANPP